MIHPAAHETRLDGAVQDWSAAAAAWDAAALAALYAHDAMLLGGRDGHAVGREAIRAYFESYAGVILSAQLTLHDQELRLLGETALVAQGFGDFAFTLSTGPTRQLMRTTLVLDWRGGKTLIRTHHFSPVPAAPPLGN